MFKLKSLGLKKEVERIQNLSHTKHVWLLRNIYTPSLSLLLKQFSQMRLIGYFEVIFELKDELVYDHHCRFLISSFHEKYQNSNYKVKKIKSQEFPLIYKIDYNSSGDFGYVNNFYKVNDTGDIVSFNDFEFKKEDFFFLLTENINLIALHL